MNPVTINTQPLELKFPTIDPSIRPDNLVQTDRNTESFKDTLSQFVNSVNDLQHQASDMETSFLKGEVKDVHQVMIAVEEASTAFELLMEIRNKLLDSYQQITRMPI